MDYKDKAIAEFVKARDEAITAAACKGCLQITNMPEDVKVKARKWLLDRGLSLEAW